MRRPVDPESFERVMERLDEALELSREQRAAFLESIDDDALREELAELIAAHEEPSSVLADEPDPDELADAFRTALRELEPQLPDRIGDYQVLEILGEGGMGTVYLGEQETPLRRRVAIKQIRAGVDTRQVVARFEAERDTLARLQHHGIAQMHGAGVTSSGHPYFVMEPIPGAPITRFCDERRLGIRARIGLCLQVCDAVEHAHRRGILHRDLKPSNVLVTEEGAPPTEAGIVKVIDFGIARALDTSRGETLLTEDGQLLGTPEYMSPEQAARASGDDAVEALDTRSDVFSLGALFYELLVGERPFESDDLRGERLDRVVEALRTRVPVPPRTRLRTPENRLSELRGLTPERHRAALRGDLEWILMRCLEPDRERRYPNVAELAADLRRHLRVEPVRAGPPGLGYSLSVFARRHPWGLAASATVLLSMLLSSLAFLLFGLEARREEQRARRNADLDEARVAQILRLSDRTRLELLREQAATLWPARPEIVERLEAWLGSARAVAARLDMHRLDAKQLGEELANAEALSASDRAERTWHLEALLALVAELERFAVDAETPCLISSLASRLQTARHLSERSLVAHRERWTAACEAIAGTGTESPYHGLVLEPQVGLVPLGPDPHSKLWEFCDIATGDLVVRGADGQLELQDSSGLVLVLIPAGTFRPGPPSAPGEDERPPVRVEAFFLAKHEMTQAQWTRHTGRNPSGYPDGRTVRDRVVTGLHPVESVSAEECDQVLRELGYRLPSEHEWEYAARAGTDTIWWSGNERESARGALNIADAAAARAGAPWDGIREWPELDDGHVIHAPAGTFRENPFGLGEIYGNVAEWCRAPESESGTGSGFRSLLGGNYQGGISLANSFRRDRAPSGSRFPSTGLRPLREILP